MADQQPGDPLFTVRDWPAGPASTVQIHSKYLNYDVADSLKARLRAVIQEKLDGGKRTFVLDLGKVSIVDSCGVGLMIGLHNLVHGAGGTLWLVGITHFLQKIFKMMHLDQYFHVAVTEDDVKKQVPARVA